MFGRTWSDRVHTPGVPLLTSQRSFDDARLDMVTIDGLAVGPTNRSHRIRSPGFFMNRFLYFREVSSLNGGTWWTYH